MTAVNCHYRWDAQNVYHRHISRLCASRRSATATLQIVKRRGSSPQQHAKHKPYLQFGKLMAVQMTNSQKHIFESEKQRLCSSRFRRTYFSNSKSNDSVDTECTKTNLSIKNATMVLVWISQNMLFQYEKQWFCWYRIHRRQFSNQKSDDGARLDFAKLAFSNKKSDDSLNTEFAKATCRIRKTTIVLVWISQNILFQLEKRWLSWYGIHRRHFPNQKSDDRACLDFAEHAFPIWTTMIRLIWQSQKQLSEKEKQRSCSSGFRRTDFSNLKSNGSVDTESTEASFLISEATIVLVWIL